MLTLDQAKNLKPGDVLLTTDGKRWKVNGKIKRWKRDPNRIRIPLKHGLYAHDAITETDFDPAGNSLYFTGKEKP